MVGINFLCCFVRRNAFQLDVTVKYQANTAIPFQSLSGIMTERK